MEHYNIPYGKQNITEADIRAVVNALKSDYLTQGPQILEFEQKFAEYIGCKYAVAVSNGTAALHLSSLALNVRPDDKVITTPITFAASANCVRYCEGEVLFADIDANTYLIDYESVKNIIEKDTAREIVGLVLVDFAGRAVDLEKFKELANQYGLWIIEDACHSPGGYFVDNNGEKQNCGNGNFADLAVFSFHPVKHIACGEGGMITTNDKKLYERLLQLRTHGITRNKDLFSNNPAFASAVQTEEYPGWYMEMQSLGYNYRLTDFQAALGISQLSRADEGITKRRSIAEKYNQAFTGKPFIKGQSGVIKGHAYHLYIIEVEDRFGLYNFLRSKNIFAQIHYIPCHLMPYYKQFGWKEGDFPYAENYYKHCISLPMYPTLTDEEQQYLIEVINSYYSQKI
ncbi:MAG: UDP-4-amino-4,6-dideoxy-N-acetyl-beta-L-altrosamine transaminase [Bacteroidetes bacterium]|nr:UDP-4-amino-4,6-dideoxy-N-acetyl-beta-L-altrosamine transaminase [Bacteroidota bacterium]MBS1627776.1 UDP-4-amino-4,6-dideoxy-N-acetyl-beta-L-altrosamine transaminase [Bacteroidota bacterium]MBS1649815.1 UDP-4-amino-4,6-dideoxy-N-acetyl-beta-L-altrosamine transaminase [Bacteroidota bacterium]